MKKVYIVRCSLECTTTVRADTEEEAKEVANLIPPTEWETQVWSPDEIEEQQS